ncbi:uncharacterized protein [Cherax quadricarinatus]
MSLLPKASVYVLVWAFTLPVSSGYQSEVLRVGINAQFCEHKGDKLLCDYKSTQRMVHMDEEVDSSVQKVFVHNAVKLQLSESMCVNIMLINVVDVVVVRGEGYPCKAGLQLLVRNSTLDRLPSQVSYVHLEHSIFTSLATALNINRLIVINSTIKVLDISSPLQNSNFISSKIDTLEKLHVANGSEFILYKSSVDSISSHGLIIKGLVVLKESSINSPIEESVIMFPGASLKLDSFSGNLAVKVKIQELNNDKPQVTQRSCEPCINIPDKSYWEAFIACLILLIIVSVFNITCIYMLKGKISRRDRGVKLSKKSSKTDLECSLIDGLINTSTQVTLVDIISETFAIIPVRNLDEIYSKNMEISTSLLNDKSQYEEKLREMVIKINDCGSGKISIHKIVNELNKLTKMGEVEAEHKKAQEERSRSEALVKINIDKKMMRQQASEHMEKYVQKMRENAEQVLDLWNKMIVSFDWNTFMVDPQEWLRFFKCQIKEKENCLKVQTKQQNSNYKTNEEILNQNVNERNEQLKQKFDCDISSIERDFDNEVRNASWKKETLKKLYEKKKQTCKITYEVLNWKNLYFEPQKLRISRKCTVISR